MTVAAKAIVAAYYGEAARARAYFNGCSTGGRQALTEAQRLPDDYDGIIAGAAANYPTHLQGAQVWTTKITNQSDGYIPPPKYPLIHNAVLEACDALDGVKDRVLEDPRRCHFDPQTIACKGRRRRHLPHAAQVEVARKIYAGPGPSLSFPGSNAAANSAGLRSPGPSPWRWPLKPINTWCSKIPSWDYLKFDPVRDIAMADKVAGPIMNAIDPEPEAIFQARGKTADVSRLGRSRDRAGK